MSKSRAKGTESLGEDLVGQLVDGRSLCAYDCGVPELTSRPRRLAVIVNVHSWQREHVLP